MPLDLDSKCPKCGYASIVETTTVTDRWRQFACLTCGHRWQIEVDEKGEAMAEPPATGGFFCIDDGSVPPEDVEKVRQLCGGVVVRSPYYVPYSERQARARKTHIPSSHA